MLSRRHIRAKVMQALYSYWNSGGEQSKGHVEKNLTTSLEKLFDLYLYLLLFLEALGDYVYQYDDDMKAKHLPSSKDSGKFLRLHSNRIMQAIINSKNFHNKCEWRNISWQGDTDLLKKVFFDLKNSEIYDDYIHSDEPEEYQDLEIMKHIVKHYPDNFGLVSQHLDEQFFNWHDDKKITRQMVTKTLDNIAMDPESDDFLLPLSVDDDENFGFAKALFNWTVDHDDEFQAMISDKIQKYEPSQVAVIDLIIIKMGICEFMYFPSIPTKVTINEYIELTKNYSLPKSKNFVNGILDKVLKELKQKGKVEKAGRGLYEN